GPPSAERRLLDQRDGFWRHAGFGKARIAGDNESVDPVGAARLRRYANPRRALDRAAAKRDVGEAIASADERVGRGERVERAAQIGQEEARAEEQADREGDVG